MRLHPCILPFFIPLCFIILSFNIYVATSQCLGHQQSLLLHMKHNLEFNPTKSNKLIHWNQSGDCCQWNGVLCNKGHVIGLDLSEEFLVGGLDNSSLFNLKHLRYLNLAYNNFHSLIPSKFGMLQNLTYLNLSNAGFEGQTPNEIFQMQKLKVLDLSNNQDLHGSLPNFSQDGNLQTLNLGSTNFSGKLPSSIFNLKQLSMIDLSNCQFNGVIPTSLSGLTQLFHLDLSFNNFTGPLPSLNISKNLAYLSLLHNGFTGPIPSSYLKGLTNLHVLNLGDNSLNGKVPSTLFTLQSLQELILSHNGFDGLLNEFPNASFSTLQVVDLSNNKLQGQIPVSFIQFPNLEYLHLSSNQFNGTIRLYDFQRLQNLHTLGLSHNKLLVDTTVISDDPGLLAFPKMANLYLASCKVREFPNFLRNQSQLLSLDLSKNQIQGRIPNWIWRYDYLIHLNLSNNFLTSLEGPFENISSNMFLIDLHSNHISGFLPIFTKNIVYLDYSNNRFSFIPPNLRKYLRFTLYLSLSNNSFHGKIPQSFCNCSNLRVLDLSHNGFNGSIPKCLTSRSNALRVLDLVGNNLTGSIPDTSSSSCNLRFLDLNGNLLKGTIPKSFTNCQSLQVLNLGNNLLSDRFPCFLRHIPSLRILILRSNKLHGSIGCQRSTGKWKMLHIVDIASNDFVGTLPHALLQSWTAMIGDAQGKSGNLVFDFYDFHHSVRYKDLLAVLNKDLVVKLSKMVVGGSRFTINNIFSYLVNVNQMLFWGEYLDSVIVTNKGLQMKLVKIPASFTSLDVSSNHFVGPIPNELTSLKALIVINMSHNAFSSHIPSSLGNLTQIESLDLSSNILSGEIPTEIATLSFLSVLNLSFNHLVGKIPTGTQIQSFQVDSFEGNEGLCGPPLTNCIDDGVPNPISQFSKTPSSIEWNFLSVELGFIFGFGLVILPLMLWEKWRLWYNKYVEKFLCKTFPQLYYVYVYHQDQKYRSLRWRHV